MTERFVSGSLAGAIAQSSIYPMEVRKVLLVPRRRTPAINVLVESGSDPMQQRHRLVVSRNVSRNYNGKLSGRKKNNIRFLCQ